MEWAVSNRRKAFRLDPALKDLKQDIRAALLAVKLDGLQNEQHLYAIQPDSLPDDWAEVHGNGATLLFVMDGPTPVHAQRVPRSLVLLPLGAATMSADGNLLSVAEALVREIVAREAFGSPGFDLVSMWREEHLSCEAAGEPATATAGSRDFQALLAGHLDDQTQTPFSRALVKACKMEGVLLDDLLNFILKHNTVWYSPYTGTPIGLEEAIDIFRIIQQHWQDNSEPAHCFGAQYWNHPSIQATFSGKGGPVAFHETQQEAIEAASSNGGRILSWAGRTDAAFEEACASRNIQLHRIEDGFLRSVGLGAGLARGAMLAVDDLGIYYDPSRPSRLEMLLKDYELTEAEVERGRKLVQSIKSARVSKYNFGKVKAFTFPADKHKILVPGQVADDAAIRKSKSATIDCANTPNVNLDLLKLARDRNPDAYMVFKPHPDVETGLRKGKVSREEALCYADEVAEDANIIDLIDAVDAVETFSSLSGFEALLRVKKVTVHGAPFYAGWGLSEDLTEIAGRGRVRTLPELVYLALVQYARTIDPVSMLPCSPEFLVSRLLEQREDRKHLFVTTFKRRLSWLGRKLGL